MCDILACLYRAYDLVSCPTYHIAGNFNYREFMENLDFVEKTFVDCSLIRPTVHLQSTEPSDNCGELSLIGTRQQSS